MTGFVKALRLKGWSAKELAERWGITPRQISNIGKNPSVMNMDALAGLPEKKHQQVAKTDEMTVNRCLHCGSDGRIINDFSCVRGWQTEESIFWHGNQYVKCTNQKCGAQGGKEFVTTNDVDGNPDMGREDVVIAIRKCLVLWNREST